LVAGFKPGGQIGSDCADDVGNVFIPNDDKVLKYAHGDTAPNAALSLPGSHALACAVDPATGNLAVIFSGSGTDVAVFPDASGSPTLYNAHNLPAYCGYDGSGDLFVDGIEGTGHYALAVLPSGASDFSKLSLPQSAGQPGQVQWDSTYIT
jgi:hypothetical protein